MLSPWKYSKNQWKKRNYIERKKTGDKKMTKNYQFANISMTVRRMVIAKSKWNETAAEKFIFIFVNSNFPLNYLLDIRNLLDMVFHGSPLSLPFFSVILLQFFFLFRIRHVAAGFENVNSSTVSPAFKSRRTGAIWPNNNLFRTQLSFGRSFVRSLSLSHCLFHQ